MDRNFARSLSLVLKHEGGWADNPKDPGGATMKGVTLASFRRYVKPKATKDDLRKITDEQLAAVYRRHYWDEVLGAKLPDGIDYAVFDYGVNSGPATAVKALQKLVGATADGKIGPATLKAIAAHEAADLINDYLDARLAFMKRIKHKQTGELLWKTFGKGWGSRVAGVRKEALKLAAAPTPEKPSIIHRTVEIPIEVEVDRPVVPAKVEQKVKEKADRLTGGFGVVGILGTVGSFFAGMEWQALAALSVGIVIVLLIFVLLRTQIVSAVRDIKAEVAQ